MTNSEILALVLSASGVTAAICAAIIYNQQLGVMQSQLEEMRSTSKQTDALIESNKKSAEAAADSAKATIAISSQARAAQRPWLQLSIPSLNHDPEFRDGQEPSLGITVEVTNVGLAPATDVYVASMAYFGGPIPTAVAREFRSFADKKGGPFLTTIFPGKAATPSGTMFARPNDEHKKLPDRTQGLFLIVCAYYKAANETADDPTHVTSTIYLLQRRGDNDWLSDFASGKYSINNLRLIEHPMGTHAT